MTVLFVIVMVVALVVLVVVNVELGRTERKHRR